MSPPWFHSKPYNSSNQYLYPSSNHFRPLDNCHKNTMCHNTPCGRPCTYRQHKYSMSYQLCHYAPCHRQHSNNIVYSQTLLLCRLYSPCHTSYMLCVHQIYRNTPYRKPVAMYCLSCNNRHLAFCMTSDQLHLGIPSNQNKVYFLDLLWC